MGEASTNFDVIMLGPMGTGKTSILATMYDEIKRNNKNIFGIKSKDLQRSGQLNQKLGDLKAMAEGKITSAVINKIEPTQRLEQYPFAVSVEGENNPRFNINFCDHKGGLINNAGSDEKSFKELCDHVNRAHVIINAVDACAMVEIKGFHEKQSHPAFVSDILEQALDDEQNQLVIIGLTKCETYLKEKELLNKMFFKLEEEHKRVFNVVETINKKRNNTLLVVVPIKTIGGIKFKRYEELSDGSYEFIFGRDGDMGFQPELADFVFNLSVAFILKQAYKNRGIYDKFFDFFGGEKRFKSTVNKSLQQAKDIINDNNHKIRVYGETKLLGNIE